MKTIKNNDFEHFQERSEQLKSTPCTGVHLTSGFEPEKVQVVENIRAVPVKKQRMR